MSKPYRKLRKKLADLEYRQLLFQDELRRFKKKQDNMHYISEADILLMLAAIACGTAVVMPALVRWVFRGL